MKEGSHPGQLRKEPPFESAKSTYFADNGSRTGQVVDTLQSPKDRSGITGAVAAGSSNSFQSVSHRAPDVVTSRVENMSVPVTKAAPGSSSAEFPCKYCPRILKRECTKVQHERTHYKCRFCRRQFDSMTPLLKHHETCEELGSDVEWRPHSERRRGSGQALTFKTVTPHKLKNHPTSTKASTQAQPVSQDNYDQITLGRPLICYVCGILGINFKTTFEYTLHLKQYHPHIDSNAKPISKGNMGFSPPCNAIQRVQRLQKQIRYRSRTFRPYQRVSWP